MHLADDFIQSNLHCIQGINVMLIYSLGIEPMTVPLLLQESRNDYNLRWCFLYKYIDAKLNFQQSLL